MEFSSAPAKRGRLWLFPNTRGNSVAVAKRWDDVECLTTKRNPTNSRNRFILLFVIHFDSWLPYPPLHLHWLLVIGSYETARHAPLLSEGLHSGSIYQKSRYLFIPGRAPKIKAGRHAQSLRYFCCAVWSTVAGDDGSLETELDDWKQQLPRISSKYGRKGYYMAFFTAYDKPWTAWSEIEARISKQEEKWVMLRKNLKKAGLQDATDYHWVHCGTAAYDKTLVLSEAKSSIWLLTAMTRGSSSVVDAVSFLWAEPLRSSPASCEDLDTLYWFVDKRRMLASTTHQTQNPAIFSAVYWSISSSVQPLLVPTRANSAARLLLV